MRDRRDNARFTPPESLIVYDCATGQPLGAVVNMSTDGAMLVTDRPLKPAASFRCRVELHPPVIGHSRLHFDAECRWSRKNIVKNRWESGFHLQATGDDAFLVSYLVLGFKLCNWGDPTVRDAKTVELANRRRTVRFEFDDPLPVFEPNSYRPLGVLGDLSVEGFRIITEQPLTADGTLKCRLRLPRKVFQQEYLTLTARCRWSRKLADGTGFESGHSLLNVSHQDTAVIMHLLIHYGKPQQCEKKIAVIR